MVDRKCSISNNDLPKQVGRDLKSSIQKSNWVEHTRSEKGWPSVM